MRCLEGPCMVHCPRAAGVGVGVATGLAMLWAAHEVLALALSVAALAASVEGVASGILVALVVRNYWVLPAAVLHKEPQLSRLQARELEAAPVQCEVRAIAAPPLAIESGLLQGQADPAMREMLRGVAAGLRDRYGTLEPDEERMGL